MKILRNYLLKEFIGPLVLTIGVLSFVMILVGNLNRIADLVINKGVDIFSVLKIFLFMAPYIVTYALPISVLVAVLLSLGRLSSDNEIIAVRASGINLFNLILPIFIIGMILSLGLTLFNDRASSYAHFAYRKTLIEVGVKNPTAAFEEGVFINSFQKYILFIYHVDQKKNRLNNIRIYEPQGEGKPTRTIVAKAGEFISIPEKKSVKLKLIDGTSDEPDPNNPQDFYKLNFKTYFMNLDIAGARDKNSIEKKVKDMTIRELKIEAARLKKEKIDPAPLLVEINEKIALAFTCLVFALIAAPLAIITRRREKSINIGIALLIMVLYYPLFIGCEALAMQNLLSPYIALWIPNVLFGIIGFKHDLQNMRILDRYVLKSVFLVFISCLFTFIFLYVVIDLLTHLEDMLKHHASIITVIKYYLSYVPIMFAQVSPFACLLSVLYTFGKMNHDNEIIAMRSSGLSVTQIAKTVVVFGLLISIFMFWLNDRVIPQSQGITEKLRIQVTEDASKSKDKKLESISSLSMYGTKNRLFFINKFTLGTSTMEGITILEHDEHQNIIKKVVAAKGVYNEGLWKFFKCITYDFDLNGQIIGEPQYFPEEIMAIPETPAEFASQRQRPDFMSLAQLDDYIWRLSKSGATSVIRSLRVDFYERFTSPFTCLIIMLLGIPFSLIMKRKATGMSSIGLSIMVGFLYYILDAICAALGKGGVLFPLLAASLSHLIALSYGIYLIRTLP